MNFDMNKSLGFILNRTALASKNAFNQEIKAEEITQAWKNVEDKKARYRYVIDTATI